MLRKAIVRKPCKNLIKGITSAELGVPNHELAIHQHQKYVEALIRCGLKVTVLPEDENYPDSTFIEDTAIVTEKCAVIALPGAKSRKGEIIDIKNVLKRNFSVIEKIENPGTLEGGDVLRVGNHFYIGLSERTNDEGAAQLITILNKYGFSGSVILLSEFLHLKSGAAYIENNNLLLAGELLDSEEFKGFNIIRIDDDECYAANSVWINGSVIVPQGNNKTSQKIKNLGYNLIELELSEFRKLDGGASCLSLRF
jgi:dimethylargininase